MFSESPMAIQLNHLTVFARDRQASALFLTGILGLPPPVVARAREILNGLERDELSRGGRPSLNAAASAGTQQLGLFQAPAPQDDPVLKRLREIDVNNITPVQALSILESLKREAGGT